MPSDTASHVLQSTSHKLLRYDFPNLKNNKVGGYIFVVLRNNTISIQRRMKRDSIKLESLPEGNSNIPDYRPELSSFYGIGHAYRTSNGKLIAVNYLELWKAIYILEKEDVDGATCIKLCLEDIGLKDIADVMEVSFNRVRNIDARAKRRLKVILERENRC